MVEDPDSPGQSAPRVAKNGGGCRATSDEAALDDAVFQLARLLGRQIARQHFAAIQVKNNASEPDSET
jgi:hypothetical protein